MAFRRGEVLGMLPMTWDFSVGRRAEGVRVHA